MRAFALAVLAFLAATAGAEPSRTALPSLWLAAALPPRWSVDAGGRLDAPGGAATLAFREGEPAEAALKLKSLTQAGGAGFRAGTIERRGPWSTLETWQTRSDGTKARTFHAVRVWGGGYYRLSVQAAEPAYAGLRRDALLLLDGLARTPPALAKAPYKDAGGRYELAAPAAPWSAAADPDGAGVSFLGPEAPGDGRRPLFSVRRFEKGGRYPDADAYLKEEARPAPGFKAARGPAGRTAAGRWLRLDTDATRKEGGPDRSLGTVRSRASFAVLSRDKDFFVLVYQAPYSIFDDYRPAFEEIVASFKPR